MASDKENYRRLALYSSLIFALPVTLFGCVYLGLLADRHFETRPWFTLVGVFLGMAGALYELIRIIGWNRR